MNGDTIRAIPVFFIYVRFFACFFVPLVINYMDHIERE
jgi:hypothetical protein